MSFKELILDKETVEVENEVELEVEEESCLAQLNPQQAKTFQTVSAIFGEYSSRKINPVSLGTPD